jgi:hypothetical protein
VFVVGLAVVVASVVAVLVGMNLVSNDAPGATATTTPHASVPSHSPTTLDSQAAARAAVIDAYIQSYRALIAVGKEPSPDLNDPRLSQHTTGAALTAEQRALADHIARGLIYFGDAELHPTVVELGPERAVVVGCSIDTTGLADAQTGAVVEGGGDGGGLADTAELILVDGTWKVNNFKDEKRSCVPPVA